LRIEDICMADLSIIIINWNSADYVLKCIETIKEQTVDTNYEIIVVDNASFDGIQERLSKLHPDVIFIQSHHNLGFARGNNLGAKYASGSVFLFLNPDTEIRDHAIDRLFNCIQDFSDCGALGAKLLNSDGSTQTSCVQAFPTILNQVLDAEAIRKLFPKSRLWGIAPLFSETRLPSEVDVVSGACLMIKRKVFEEVEMFSTEYFMYSEDVDLCYKVRKAGWKTYYVPFSIVVHHGGGSSSQVKVNTFSSIMMLESRWRFFKKTRPLWYCWLYRFSMVCVSVARLTLSFFSWPYFRVSRKADLAEAILKKWNARLLWSLGKQSLATRSIIKQR